MSTPSLYSFYLGSRGCPTNTIVIANLNSKYNHYISWLFKFRLYISFKRFVLRPLSLLQLCLNTLGVAQWWLGGAVHQLRYGQWHPPAGDRWSQRPPPAPHTHKCTHKHTYTQTRTRTINTIAYKDKDTPLPHTRTQTHQYHHSPPSLSVQIGFTVSITW